MKPIARGAVVIIQGGHVALMKRVNDRGEYYLFPGGGLEADEDAEQAAVREAKEELGVDVRIIGLLGIVEYRGREQHFFAAEIVGGRFGTGAGEELSLPPDSPQGTYTPVWMSLRDVGQRNVRPPIVAEMIRGGLPRRLGAPWRVVESMSPTGRAK